MQRSHCLKTGCQNLPVAGLALDLGFGSDEWQRITADQWLLCREHAERLTVEFTLTEQDLEVGPPRVAAHH